MKKAWLSMVLLLATGCSEVHRPRLGEDANPPRQARRSDPARLERERRARMDAELRDEVIARCDQKLASGEVHLRRLGEYAEIRGRLERLNPAIGEDPELHRNAHRKAFLKAKDVLFREMMADSRMAHLRSRFRRQFVSAFGSFASAPRLHGNLMDLITMFGSVLYIGDGTPCSSYYLQIFYREYVRALDPFARLEFGDAEALSASADPSGTSTLDLPLQGAESDREFNVVQSAPLLGSFGGVPWITLRDWDLPEVMEAATAALVSEKVVLDLRFATGRDPEALRKLSAAFAARPESARALILVNSSTRGIASVFARRMAERAGVKVIGSSSRTYGYARLLKREVVVLTEDASAVSLILASDPIEFEGEVETALALSGDSVTRTMAPVALIPLLSQ